MMTAHLNLFLWAILIPSNLPCSANRIYKNTFLFDPHILNARLYISLYSFLLLYTGIKKIQAYKNAGNIPSKTAIENS